MSPNSLSIAQPQFIIGAAGSIFVLHHRPAESLSYKGTIIFVPPFNEEMNRSRSMLTLLATQLNTEGYGLAIVDLYGTGDSAGNYVDGSWEIWRQDIVAVADWLENEGFSCIGLLGLRLGALLAAEVFVKEAGKRFEKLLFWQPVTDGKIHLVQFLRIRLAANLERQTKEKETTKLLRSKLVDEGSVEVAGYEISRELADAIDNVKIDNYFEALPGATILWLEHRNEADQPLPKVLTDILSKCEKNKLKLDFNTFVGPAFWQMHERTLAPEVIQKTLNWLQQA